MRAVSEGAAVGQDRTIGVLIPLVSGPYFGTVLTGIMREATASGYRSIVVQTLDAALGDAHPEQRQMLMDLGCQRAQGYLFARPLTPDQLAEFTPLHLGTPPSVGVSPG